MIKFFRKIRQNLLSENKFSKYLIYAIGEIVLVVIGILIALQLNNLNETNKNKEYEKEYLFRIQSDINQDIAELKRHFNSDTLKLDSYTFIGRFFYSDTIKTSPETLFKHINTATRLNWFEGKNIVFEEMKSSGKTSLIESDNLRSKIQNYYRLFEEVIKQETLNNNNILKLSYNINEAIEVGSFIEIGMPQRWNINYGQITTDDLFNILSDLDENQKNIFIDNYSQIKGQILFCNAIRLDLYQEAIKMTKSIDDYLTLKK